MMWLIFSVVSSSALMVIFKLFGRFKVEIFPAIVFNYLTCFILGNLFLGQDNLFSNPVWNQPWLPRIAVLGFFFISAFYLMGLSTRNAGAGATSVAAKMSVVLPAAYSIVFLKEPVYLWQLMGMALSLVCVYLMRPINNHSEGKNNGLWVLVLVFIGSGLVDTGLNMVKNHYGAVVNDYKLSTIVFGSAGIIGLIILLFFYKGKKPGMRELLGGMLLGTTNYLSLLAMFGGIGHYNGSTAWFFAVNNIGVVALSTLVSVIFFKEKISTLGYFGLGLSAVAIILMNLNVVF